MYNIFDVTVAVRVDLNCHSNRWLHLSFAMVREKVVQSEVLIKSCERRIIKNGVISDNGAPDDLG